MGYRCVPSILFIFIGVINCLYGEKSLVINTSFGPIKGAESFSTWTNQTIYSFKGIPYASPPVGRLRFKEPILPEKWSEIRDCTNEQAICPQSVDNTSGDPLGMSEDCLYLNVFTPQLLSSDQELMPVMVWLHGGAFMLGSANFDLNGPDMLVAEGVVVVTLNYRLGALGFLSMGMHDAPGNVGLKDQRQALLWVSNEIQNFGGDPKKVTVFGWSAGAISIHLHYLSPSWDGLFQRAICQSGSPLAYRVREDGLPFALELAKQLDCDSQKSADEVLTCLRAANFQDIIRAQSLVKAPYQDYVTNLGAFAPIIDRGSGVKPLIPDFPFNLLKQKKTSFVPFLMGINRDEGLNRFSRESEDEIKNITNNLEHLYALQVPGGISCPPKMKAEKLKQFYFRDDLSSTLDARGYIDVYTDVLYAIATLMNAKAYQITEKVFLYYFSYNGKFKQNSISNLLKKYNISGVTHGEELNYISVKKDVNQTSEDDSNESITWQRMVTMWTNFAKYGSPTVGADPRLQRVQWLPASEGRTNHLYIDVDLEMRSEDMLASHAALWDSINFNNCDSDET